jgi:hypothetical protein
LICIPYSVSNLHKMAKELMKLLKDVKLFPVRRLLRL